MKNIDILNLVNSGILYISANELDSTQAYKVIKFKKEIKNALNAIVESEKDILKEAGIEDGMAFDKEREELMKSNSNPKRIEEMNKQYARFAELRNSLYDEEVKIDCKALPFEQYHELQKENKELKGKPLNVFEDLLEGLLWVAPEEKSE